MVDAPLVIVFKMAKLFLDSTIDTAVEMIGLFGQLITSLAYTISVAGPIGVIIALVILVPTLYCLSKFFGDTLKTAVVGVAIVLIVFSIIAVVMG